MSSAADELKVIIPNKLFFKIGEVAELVGVEPYVLRYWETEFNLRPSKSKKQQRLYQRKDIESILRIKKLLYEERYTIEGARKRLKELKKLKQNEQLTLLAEPQPKVPAAQPVSTAPSVPLIDEALASSMLERLKSDLRRLKQDILAPL